MELPIAQFFMQTSRTHASMVRETGIIRQKIERWVTDNKPVWIEFDERTEVINKITERPLLKTHYKRGSK